MGETELLIVLVSVGVGLAAGFNLHAAWSARRIRIHAVLGRSGPVEWVVNLGRPIVGKFGTREEAKRHASRIRSALYGRADEERRHREPREGQSSGDGAERSQP